MPVSKKSGKVLVAATAGAVAGMMIKKLRNNKKEQENARILVTEEAVMNNRSCGSRGAHLVGEDPATVAVAAYLVRDHRLSGKQITIYEGMHTLDGSSDGIGTPEKGSVRRGGCMLNGETYENFWELLDSIPSLRQPGRNVTEEISSSDHAYPIYAKTRLVDKGGVIQDVKFMGFNQADRAALLKLLPTDEKRLDSLTIQDWFKEIPRIFETNFWYIRQTIFAFQKWSSLYESRGYMSRMIFEFSRIETLEGVTRTPLSQYDSVIRPLEACLGKAGVTFVESCEVTDIDLEDGHDITVKTLYPKHRVENTDDTGESGETTAKDSYMFGAVALNSNDICIMTNACVTGSATLGDFCTPAPIPVRKPISGELRAKVAAKKPGLGNLEPFFMRPHETNWLSFTVTCKEDAMLKIIEEFTENIPGSSALMTFKDSSWLMNSMVVVQSRFVNRSMGTTIFWGYGLYTDATGDYVRKPMKDCTGQESLNEHLHHLHTPKDQIAEPMKTVTNVIPCYMPYVDAQFEPRKYSDRPWVTPADSTNFAMVSQFVGIPDDMVFTEKHSVRAARTAVHDLLDVEKVICPVTPYSRQPKTLMKALKKAYL